MSGVGGGGLNLTADETRVLNKTKEENSRRGGWVRIFPTPDTWETYRFVCHIFRINNNNNKIIISCSQQGPLRSILSVMIG